MGSPRLLLGGAKLRPCLVLDKKSHRQFTANANSTSERKDLASRQDPAREHRAHKRKVNRDFFLSVLGTSATKRDAKSYLSRFNSDPNPYKSGPGTQREPVEDDKRPAALERRVDGRVNLGRLYAPTRALEESPLFVRQRLPDKLAKEVQNQPLHVAIVKIRAPQTLDDETLSGVGLTLSQLARLGLRSIVLVDCQDGKDELPITKDSPHYRRRQVLGQSLRVVDAIKRHRKDGVRIVDQALELSRPSETSVSNQSVTGESIHLRSRELLYRPLLKGIIPVVPALACTGDSQIRVVEADNILLTLTQELSRSSPLLEETDSQDPITISLDRLVVLDPVGGIPTRHPNKVHTFVNLLQERSGILEDLQRMEWDDRNFGTKYGHSNSTMLHQSQRHAQTLECLHRCLSILPPSASALLTTPQEVSSSALSQPTVTTPTGVRTRPKKNPLIHNLLTDKSLVSSSLPPARLPTSESSAAASSPPVLSTLLKLGLPLNIIPDPHINPWHFPGPGHPSLDLATDPRIDLPRLVHLIEDSFGRPLNVEHYFSRIQGHVAGVIIAGAYEGGAILTWERPPGPRGATRPLVPYLDKFAVLRRSQGQGGVADVLFNAMVRSCFPSGVVWRSRRNNPVNKWYFERACGSWRVPGSQWTMFWTGNEVDVAGKVNPGEVKERWKDYVSVCESVVPSWADGKPPD